MPLRYSLLPVFLLVGTFCTFSSAARGEEAFHIQWETVQPLDRFFSEGISTGDLDGDGQLDLVVGPMWFAGPDYTERHWMEPGQPVDPHGYAPHFFSFTEDFDGDGDIDVLQIGFPGQAAYWLENPGTGGDGQRWARHEVIDRVDNESPTFQDITGDGQRELIFSHNGRFGYATPNPDDPRRPWDFHAISEGGAGGQFTHGLGIGDVNGDGRMDLLEKNGWWEQPESLEGDPLWTHHPFPFSGPGGSQMFATDVDGDGDMDVITALAAHGYGVAWYEQIGEGEERDFRQHLIVGSSPGETPYGVVFSQPHALRLADIDGDGIQDIVTGKRTWAHGPHGDPESMVTPVVYWFRCVRGEDGVRFEPYVISHGSGVGVDVLVDDVDRDGLLDVLVANKEGAFVHRQTRTSVDAGEARRLRPVSADAAAKPLPSARLPETGLLPPEAAAQFTVPDGFAVDLVAGEPDLHQPVAFCFDSRGRIWVAEAHTYPIRAEDGQGSDKIRIYEDADGDGHFETHKTFADGLNLISGLEVGYGGVWVGAAPYLMFIPDADGDDRPDAEPQIVLDGFGYQDTHETLNAFTWGPDGWLYGCQGVFVHSLVGVPGTPDAERTSINAGVWRFHPVRKTFEVFAAGTSNPWGVTFDERGQAIITACVIPHAFHMIQGGRYHRQAGQHFDPYTFDDIKTIADHAHYAGDIRDHAWWGRDEAVEDDATSAAGGGHAHCGALIYYGDNWPASYRGALLMHNLHGNRINVDRLRRDGTGFIASHDRDLAFANDPWFRGIALRVGPDGAVYIIDWYDKNACHRATPEIWDRTNGRMYRLRFGDIRPRAEDLTAADDQHLVELLVHENQWHARHARQVLAHRAAAGQDLSRVRADLVEKAAEAGPEAQRLCYLWAAHGIAPLTGDEALRLLTDRNEAIRAWAIQLACESGAPERPVLDRMAELATSDGSPMVHLYLASALQRIAGSSPSDVRWSIAEGLVARGDSQFDRNLPLMIWYGVSPLVAEDTPRAFDLARRSAVPLVRQFVYRRAASDPQLVAPLVAAIAEESDGNLVQMMVRELADAAPRLGKIEMPEAWPRVVQRSAEIEDAEVRRAIQSLSVSFGDASVFPVLRQVVLDAEHDAQQRREALDTLARGGDPELQQIALRLLEDSQLRADALPLLGRFEDPEIPRIILDRYPNMNPSLRRVALDTLASRTSHAVALLDAIEAERVPRTDMTAVHAAKIRELDGGALQERLAELWGVVGSTPEEIEQEIARMRARYTPEVLAEANTSRGRLLYNQSCGQCHKLFGAGEDIGPDLTGSNRTNIDYLLENILAPNAIVGKDYQAISVLTLDGRVVTGLLRQETDAAIVLHDAEKLVTIPQSEIDAISTTPRSVMPEGILQPYSDQQVRDLLAYLQSPAQVPLAGSVPEISDDDQRVPGAIEAESLAGAMASMGSLKPQGMQSFDQGQWSGQSQLWWTGGQSGSELKIPVEVTEDGTYELSIALTKAPDYAAVTISVDGEAAIEGLDLFEPGRVISTGPLSLGTRQWKAGQHEVTIQIVGANADAVPSMMVGVDYLYLAHQ